MCDTKNKNSDGFIGHCQKSVKLWNYVNKLIIMKQIYIGIQCNECDCDWLLFFFHKKYKCGVTCVTYFRYMCDVRDIDLVMDNFLS